AIVIIRMVSPSLFLLSRCVRFPSPRSAQNIFQSVIGFMASVLVDRFIGCGPGVFAGPRAIPRCRIFDRETIQQSVRRNASESFDHAHVFRGTTESRLIGKVRGFDHERVAFPAPYGVTHPLANGFWKMLRVHPDDASVVHHLGENHHGVLRLNDLMQIVVEVVWKYRRSGSGTETQDAAFTKRTTFGIVVSSRRLESWIPAFRGIRCRSQQPCCGALSRGC